ncbi:MAG TPA: hypothetical protein DCO75_10220, partial [Fibrobacteres bacterium]|nr:hypothetical protein [Fibrobacterota bacterium]
YTFGKEYQQDAFFPQNIAGLSEPFIYRDFRGTIARVFPFQYNPVKKILRVYSKISVTVSSVSTDTENVLKRTHALSAGVDAEYNQYYQTKFANYAPTHYTILTEDGSMLVIAPSSFMSTMAPYIEWKRKKGLTVDTVSVTTAGTTTAEIKSYISSAYSKNSKLKYVLLVGDSAQLPTPTISYSGYTLEPVGGGGADILYGEISGSDCYSELLIGRFSGTTASDIKTQVDRSIYYETGMKTTDTWLSRALLTASNDNESTDNSVADAYFVNQEYDTLLKAGYTSSTALRYNEEGVCGSSSGCYTATTSAVSKVLDSGVAFWNYVDHGAKTSYSAASFYNDNATALTNTNKYFYTYAVACNPGQFCNFDRKINSSSETGDCLGEALMKAQTNSKPVGAIGCYMGSISQVWDPPYRSVKQILEISLQRYSTYKRYTLGGVMINGGMKAYSDFPSNDGKQIVESYILFGDPNLQIYTTTPKAMTFSHASTCSTGSQAIAITGSVDGASVCIYNGKEGIQSVGTISSGTASLTVAPTTVGDTLYVTSMLFNYVTYQGTIIISSGSNIINTYNLSRLRITFTNNKINYEIPASATNGSMPVSLKLFALNGALAATLVNEMQGSGNYSVALDNVKNRRLARGMYLIEMKIGDFVKSAKIVIK